MNDSLHVFINSIIKALTSEIYGFSEHSFFYNEDKNHNFQVKDLSAIVISQLMLRLLTVRDYKKLEEKYNNKNNNQISFLGNMDALLDIEFKLENNTIIYENKEISTGSITIGYDFFNYIKEKYKDSIIYLVVHRMYYFNSKKCQENSNIQKIITDFFDDENITSKIIKIIENLSKTLTLDSRLYIANLFLSDCYLILTKYRNQVLSQSFKIGKLNIEEITFFK
ncbi:hypothetical protein AB837_00353 [bacterium AB1]|nr:hypothetical protein AB837_00353 [bacterium AB1]